jgi:hypothetical protein
MNEEILQEAKEGYTPTIPEVGSIGLYGQGMDVISGSFGPANEEIANAIARLQAKFKSLLAARLVKLTLNASSSHMNVSTTMRIDGLHNNNGLAAQAFTARGTLQRKDTNQSNAYTSAKAIEFENGIPLLSIGTPIKFEIQNQDRSDLYITVLVITPESDMFVLFPNSWTAGETAAILEAGQTRTIPDPNQGDTFQITVGEPLGTAEVLVIASATPLSNALKRLQQIARGQGTQRGPIDLNENAPAAIDELLEDLNRGTRSLNVTYAPNMRTADTSKLAAMSITFRSIEAQEEP